MRKVIVLLAIFGLLVMVENKPALAVCWAPRLISSDCMTPNLPAIDGLRELVNYVSAVGGIAKSPLELALDRSALHKEGPEAGGFSITPTGFSTGVTFVPGRTLVNWTLVEIRDRKTHIVLQADAIEYLTHRDFLNDKGNFLVLGPDAPNAVADTAIHELLHAMVYWTRCFEGDDESLVRAAAGHITDKVNIFLRGNAGLAVSSRQTNLLSGIAFDLKTNPQWRGCYEILGLDSIWPMFGHDPQHTLSSPFTGPTSSGLRWPIPFSDGGRVFSSVSIGIDGTIYVAGSTLNDGVVDGIMLYALNPDKSLKWQYPLGSNNGWGFISPAIGPDGTVYIGSSGKLYAFLPDGSLKWDPLEFYPGWDVGINTPIIASDGLIYVTLQFSGGLGKLFAVDPSGATPAERIKWAYYPPANINGDALNSPTIGPDGTIYALFLQQPPSLPGAELVALAPLSSSGSLKWRFSAGSGVRLSPPAIDQKGNLYFGASNGNFYALKPTGRRKWIKVIGGDLSWATPAFDPDDGTLYVGSENGDLYAINSRNGASKAGWRTPYQAGGFPVPAIGSNKILYINAGGYPLAVKTDKSDVFWGPDPTGDCGFSLFAPPSIGPGETVYFSGCQSVIAVGPDPAVGPDYSPPITKITSLPISANTATFTWTGFDDLTPTSRLEYAFYLQGVQTTYSAFSTATTRSYANLPNGTYTFFVKARDQAGNEDPTPDSRTITIQAGGGGGGWGEF